MPHRLLVNSLLALATALASDALLAQVGRRTIPSWRNERLERAARISHPVYNHGLAPLASFVHAYGDVRAPYFTNSLGFRDSALRQVELASPRRRILVIGDSFTEGVGVPYEATFVGRIAETATLDNIDMLNAAVVSYAPSIYYRKIRYYIEHVGLQVSGVVVFIDLSDIEDELYLYEMDGRENVISRSPDNPAWLSRFKFFLYDNSVLSRLYWLTKESLTEKRRRESQGRIGSVTGVGRACWTIDTDLFERVGKPGLDKSRQYMDRLAVFLSARGIPLTVAVYPWPDQVLARDINSKHVRFWRAWAELNHACFVDLFPVFIDARDPAAVITEDFIPFDVHFSRAGHARLAKAFLDATRVHSLPGTPPDPQGDTPSQRPVLAASALTGVSNSNHPGCAVLSR